MKSLIKIYFKYMALAIIIIFMFIMLQMVIIIRAGVQMGEISRVPSDGKYSISRIAEEVEIDEKGSIANDSEIKSLIAQGGGEFAFMLDENGKITWEYNLSDEMNHSYTPAQVASFSKWYLNGFPVSAWEKDGMLFVIGYPKNSIWKYNIVQSMSDMSTMFKMTVLSIFGAFIFIVVLVILFGFMYYRKMRVISDGVRDMAKGKSVFISKKSGLDEIALCINEASKKLQCQRQAIEKRDEARAEWINAVSHDIRTPLSLVMGYSELIELNSENAGIVKEKAVLIKEQSMKIKKLIEDLNLASKLEYSMQPLRNEDIPLAWAIRKAAAERFNVIDESSLGLYKLNINISDEFERFKIRGDKQLMLRAFDNLIGNSIRHNPNGCEIYITAKIEKNAVYINFSDSGRGIPKEIADVVNFNKASSNHVMGLIIVKKIITAHNGKMSIGKGISIKFRVGENDFYTEV